MATWEEKRLRRQMMQEGLRPRADAASRISGAKIADLVVGSFVVDEKTRGGEVATRVDAWVRKATEVATSRGRLPLIVLTTRTGQYAIMRMRDFYAVVKEEYLK